MRLQKLIFAVEGVRRQGSGTSKNKELRIWFIAGLFVFRLFAGPSVRARIKYLALSCGTFSSRSSLTISPSRPLFIAPSPSRPLFFFVLHPSSFRIHHFLLFPMPHAPCPVLHTPGFSPSSSPFITPILPYAQTPKRPYSQTPHTYIS